jgi:hypothetical protein
VAVEAERVVIRSTGGSCLGLFIGPVLSSCDCRDHLVKVADRGWTRAIRKLRRGELKSCLKGQMPPPWLLSERRHIYWTCDRLREVASVVSSRSPMGQKFAGKKAERGGRTALCAALPNRLQGPGHDWNQRARQSTPIKRRAHASSARRHRGGFGIAVNCGKLLRSFHLITLLEWFKDCPVGGSIRDVPPPAAASLAVPGR